MHRQRIQATPSLRRCLAGVLLSLCVSLVHAADTAKEMVWMAMDFPPALIIVDGQPTNGFVDTILKMIFAEMPETRHRILITPAARGWSNLSQGQAMCFVTPLRTREREAIAYFTSTQPIPPIQLVTRNDVINKLPLNAQGEVLSAALVNQSGLRGLITPGRSYTQSLDTLLSQRNAQSDVRNVVAALNGSNILHMISRGRADYTFEFDYILAYDELRHPQLQKGFALKSLPIEGVRWQVAGIACPHTEWGRDMVIRLDAIVARLSQRPEYQAALRRWLTPDTVKRYSKELNDFYRKRAQRTPASEYQLRPASAIK